ncbi:MAG: hypothetical protein JWM80_4102 [Cyanobacteria bacterium RYN_339]|nr:hypothetical protein [Cyanobacteria bacterium RYN_339]
MQVIGRMGLGALIVANLAACGLKPGLPLAVAAVGDRPFLAQMVAAPRPTQSAFGGGDVQDGAPLDRPFSLSAGGEGLVTFAAAVPGADWELAGNQGATLKLYLDGRYNQDVVIPTGAALHPFDVSLGHVEPGPHVLRFERNGAFSATLQQRIQLGDGRVSVVTPQDPGYQIYAHAPIMLGRPESFRTDVPVVMFYDQKPGNDGKQRVRYTYVFTNEDGGTNTRALMARWGRTVDIDWCYDMQLDGAGNASDGTYQGKLHVTHDFKGRYEGAHPILRDATQNNVYDDQGDSPLKFRFPPHTRLDPDNNTRESVLDENPWIFALTSKELFREDKAVKDLGAPGAMDPKPKIADPRRFLYVDFKQSWSGRGLGVGVKLRGYAQPFYSHRGDADLTANRSGWVRVAVELPRAIGPADIERLDLGGPGSGTSVVEGVRQVQILDHDYLPVVFPISWKGSATLKNDDDRLVFYQGHRSEPLPAAPSGVRTVN